MPNSNAAPHTRLLFFSGGSALGGLCRVLTSLTRHSIHLITPFDSGGSSAKLRQAFAMPAVGDLRCRILDLARLDGPNREEQQALVALLSHRLDAHQGASAAALKADLESLAQGNHPLTQTLAPGKRQTLCQALGYFITAMPHDFDLRGASLGNLVLTGTYLRQGRRLEPSVQLLSELVEAQGQVQSLVETSLHLGARLANGQVLFGQHLLTGKGIPAIESPIRDLWLNASLDRLEPAQCQIDAKTQGLIAGADLICYPPGSFYTSLIANLLPQGVAQAIASNPCPKVYVPNLGPDPEQLGLDINSQVKQVLGHLTDKAPHAKPPQLLSHLLLDSTEHSYQGRLDIQALDALGIKHLTMPLTSDTGLTRYDAERLAHALLDLARPRPDTQCAAPGAAL